MNIRVALFEQHHENTNPKEDLTGGKKQ